MHFIDEKIKSIIPDVSRETISKLHEFVNLLLKWNKKINLIGRGTIDDIYNRHLIDSLQLSPYIPNNISEITDVGSGNGFPGIVLSIITDKKTNLVEIDKKKSIFLKEAALLLSLNVHVHNERIEEIENLPSELITARAVADIKTLFEWMQKHLKRETTLLLPKGKNYKLEVEDALKNWSFDMNLFKSIVDRESVILKIENIKRLK